jgi:hypothetical protein
MRFAIEKFEQSAVYLALAAVWAVSVFTDQVAVNENAITQMVVIIIAILAGSSNITDLLRWLAVNRDFGADVLAILNEVENQLGYNISDGLKDLIVNVADDYDAQLSKPPDLPTKG